MVRCAVVLWPAPDPAVPVVKQIRDMQTGASVSAGHEYNEWLMYQLLNILKCPEQVRGPSAWRCIDEQVGAGAAFTICCASGECVAGLVKLGSFVVLLGCFLPYPSRSRTIARISCQVRSMQAPFGSNRLGNGARALPKRLPQRRCCEQPTNDALERGAQIAAGDFLWENIWPKDANGQACNSPRCVPRCTAAANAQPDKCYGHLTLHLHGAGNLATT